ncbi:ThiF family adenylyltransferase [Alteromonas macleodii]|uniref:ThiF family adenylyltransferase n=1 Tax=Alteromonas macleodii TaxID=28108 RepID=UPI00066CC414|nr:ThiF family adenylyltransferase [Alteromonas macleodii]CAI3957784.1 Molybdopterin or thiamine biosynthesis adenylyltransferase [Alteromonas macleodii]VTP52822.1 Molybdopterin or thiamine biosynthesis adenylyltransferase [Alteromonas macleodii]|tara:strand:- start:1062 stop:2816 length:1755 start_codon:yes stop_codon:yes gene_type:complete
MTDNTLARFCQAMKDLGIEPVSKPAIGYRYDVNEAGHEFSFLIHEPDESFLRPPKVTVLRKPHIEGVRRTHIVEGNTLCFVDENNYYFDAEHPEKAASDTIGFINMTIKRMVSPTLSHDDFNNEFDAYWRPHQYAYLIAADNAKYIDRYRRRSPLSSAESEETLIHEGRESGAFKAWTFKRAYQIDEHEPIENVVQLTIRNPPVPPAADILYKWPIASWENFVLWSKAQGNSFVATMLEKLAKVALRSHDITILISYTNKSGLMHHFAVRALFKRNIRTIAKRDARARESAKKNRQNKRKLADIISMFSAQQVKSFERLGIFNASPSFVIGRNTLGDDLKGLKIGLIGCGTLGGYIASTLIKLGAGTGEGGELILSDGDLLKPENLGRHVLDANYIGEFKSFALKHFLQNSVHWPFNCELWPSIDAAHCKRLFSHCDLVIDAVGNIPLSKMMSLQLHRSEPSKDITLIHGWIDADGNAVRCLLDDRKAGCINCLRVEGKERFPIFKNENDANEHKPVAMSCGQSFTPYAASVSLAGASLIINTLLDNLHDKNTPRLRQYKANNCVPELKWQTMKGLSTCKVCKP